MNKKQRICVVCEKNRAVINICRECSKNIQSNLDNIVERTQANVALLNAVNASPEMQLAAFVNIFHPDMPASRKRKLLTK